MNNTVKELRDWAQHCPDHQKVLEAAARRIEELEASPANKLQSLGLNQDYEARGIEIEALRRDLALERRKVTSARKAEDEANEIIAKIAKAAECDNFADVILARVEALNQQSNAMTKICEGHIANCRKAEAANLKLNGELRKVQNERDDLRGQLLARCELLHDIADALNGPVNRCRDAIPAKDWYLDRVSNRHSHFREYLDIISEAVGKPGLSYKDLADYFRGLDIAMLQAKAADADKVKADAITRIRELEAALAARATRIESLERSEQKLADVAVQIQNWSNKLGTWVIDDERDPNWSKQVTCLLGALYRRLNDAEASSEASKVTLGQLASALNVDPRECGWHTKMLNKAEHLMSQVNSKDHKWDKEKTDALQSLLKEFGYWPVYNNVEGLNRFKDYVLGLKAEVRGLNESIEGLKDDMTAVQKDATAARDELALAGVAIKRMHAKLLENKLRTGIWPADGTFRAKLDDIEWCLYVYIGRAIADQQMHEADTKFISSVRDSLSHEILRRNKL